MGRLNLTTPADVQSSTLNDDLKALSTDTIQRFIDVVEGMIDRWGVYDTGKTGYAEDMKTAANMAVERLYNLSDPDYIKNAVQGVTSFKAGSYQQANAAAQAVLGGDVAAILDYYCTKHNAPGSLSVWSSSSLDPFSNDVPDPFTSGSSGS